MSVAGRGTKGRPLRFLAMTLGGWTAARVFMLWPAAIIPASAARVAALPGAAGTAGVVLQHAMAGTIAAGERSTIVTSATAAPKARVGRAEAGVRSAVDGEHLPDGVLVPVALVPDNQTTAAAPTHAAQGVIPAPLGPNPIAPGRSRLAGSAWAIVRGGGGNSGSVLGGQLGGSQAGARLTYALGEARRVALSARIATPLHRRGREAAIGIDWQPTRLPLHLLAEQRVSLDGGRGGPTLLVVGGLDPTPVLAGFRLEGYGQAGAIKRDGVEAFGDGSARLTHGVASVGPARLDLGAGVWGAVQRGARRLDVGPTLGAVVPVARTAVRVTLDWRQRVAGDARPGSGPALSVGMDF